MESIRQASGVAESAFLQRDQFQSLIDTLMACGYQCRGPRVAEDVIEFAPVTSIDDFPKGMVDHQGPGTYRLADEGGERLFYWANGPQALKRLTFRPLEVLWRVERRDGKLAFAPQLPDPQPVAVIGVRACDLAALALQEQHFLASPVSDPAFRARRNALFLVGVDCARPAATCFCANTGDGPALQSGYDVGLTELDDGFLVSPGSSRGTEVVARLALPPAGADRLAQAARQHEVAAQQQFRHLPPGRELLRLLDAMEQPQWDEIAERCLGCANCTAVCPTCFCSNHETRGTLDGISAEQVRVWDSCFSAGHSVIHGRPLRDRLCQRYRQWLIHKLATWRDQYGRSGCVGCGRCITWCPVGIDLTSEAAAIVGDEEYS